MGRPVGSGVLNGVSASVKFDFRGQESGGAYGLLLYGGDFNGSSIYIYGGNTPDDDALLWITYKVDGTHKLPIYTEAGLYTFEAYCPYLELFAIVGSPINVNCILFGPARPSFRRTGIPV